VFTPDDLRPAATIAGEMKKGVPVVEHPLGKDVFVFFDLELDSSISLALSTSPGGSTRIRTGV
jgi:hypothetical protein